jgi:hypothetical protein
MKYVFALILLTTSTSCAVRDSVFFLQKDKRIERLQSEKDKLKTQTDPVGRTKTQIKIADLLLTFISDAAMAGDTEIMESRLGEYIGWIKGAHQTMAQTGRDAHKKPGGFKDLEIALRRHVRQLEDIGGELSFDEREPVEKVRDDAAAIRDELLKALFGSQNVPTRKS